jgi:tetratricopeptide (TPR) repeat protein
MDQKLVLRSFLLITITLVFAFATLGQAVSDRDKGIALFRDAKYDEAIETLTRALAADKKSMLTRVYLGASLLKLGKDSQAKKTFPRGRFDPKEDGPTYDKPLRIVTKPRASYTDDARSNNIQGNIRVWVEFGGDGKIGFVFPVDNLPYGLTENAVWAAKDIRFEPAIKDGKAVTTVSYVEYSFSTF